MNCIARLLLPAILAAAPLSAQPALQDIATIDAVRATELHSKTVKLMAWNLEHFVDPYDDPYVSNSMEEGEGLKSDDTLKLLALAIKEMDADVMAFTEVEGDRSLRLFLDTYYPGHEYKYYASVPAIDWYQNVAVISKFPLGLITSFRELEVTHEGRTRNDINNRLMAVEVKPSADYEFLLICLHLKALPDPTNVAWRKEQLALVHDFIAREKKVDPERNIVLLGDMNFQPDTEEFQIMTTGGEEKLYAPFEKWGFPATYPSRSSHIDHFFFNEHMMKEYVEDSVAVAKPLSHRELLTISDHLPIVASIVAEEQ